MFNTAAHRAACVRLMKQSTQRLYFYYSTNYAMIEDSPRPILFVSLRSPMPELRSSFGLCVGVDGI